LKNQKIDFIDAWAVHGDSGSERTDDAPVIGYCNTAADAAAYALGKGWWGRPGKVTPVSAMVIDGDTYILAQREPVRFVEGASEALAAKHKQQDSELRARTIAGLSAEQRRVLGL
jgi:hypothetical protein